MYFPNMGFFDIYIGGYILALYKDNNIIIFKYVKKEMITHTKLYNKKLLRESV